MAKMLVVFSTLAASVEYVDWTPGPEGSPHTPGRTITIKGGAGVANDHIITPQGVATMVTEAEAESLNRNAVFQMHKKNGFVKIDTVERPPGEDAVEKAVSSMDRQDKSAPMTANDYLAVGEKPPVVGDATK